MPAAFGYPQESFARLRKHFENNDRRAMKLLKFTQNVAFVPTNMWTKK